MKQRPTVVLGLGAVLSAAQFFVCPYHIYRSILYVREF
jgi:hypothetical protein